MQEARELDLLLLHVQLKRIHDEESNLEPLALLSFEQEVVTSVKQFVEEGLSLEMEIPVYGIQDDLEEQDFQLLP